METNQLIRVGVAHSAMRAHLASTVMPLRGRSATPSAGFFYLVASLHISSDASASHFKARLATG